MKQSVWFFNQIKKLFKARKSHKKRDLISYEELVGKLVRLHNSLFIVNHCCPLKIAKCSLKQLKYS